MDELSVEPSLLLQTHHFELSACCDFDFCIVC